MLVLAVDDHTDSRMLLVDIVRSINLVGLETISAANGFEALEIARARLPDLIILDVNMPGISGFEVCEQLKADPLTAKVPILLLTALNDVENRVRGLKAGADDYLSKPVNPRELMERVRIRLRAKTETDELRSAQRQIRETFGRFVAPSVVEALLRDPTRVRLGGTLQEVTVLFVDLEGFTSISEHTEPELLLSILNRYHTMVVSAIRENGGTVDKFIGDGVMALYNTPLEQADHALRAIYTALAIRDQLPAFHEQFEPQFRMKINFGIHTGRAVVGNVGAPDIMNYTAVGDTVNLAARLQDYTHDGKIVVSETTCKLLGSRFATRKLGALKVRGRVGEVLAREIIGLAAE